MKSKIPGRFSCGHEKNSLYATAGRFPQCRVCRQAKVRAAFTQFRCGHPVTEDNIRLHGREKKYRRCRICDNERQALVNARRSAQPLPKPEPPPTNNPTILLYRSEKAKRDERVRNTVILEAKAAFDAMLQRERERAKGGRPKSANPTIGKSRRGDFGRSDPKDALVEALGPWGMSA